MTPTVVANGNGHTASDSDDDDLADLLQTSGSKSGREHVPLKTSKTKQQQPSYYNHATGGAGLCTLISAHISYLCFAYPHYCGCLACLLSLVIVTFLVTSLVNPTQQFGVVKNDWTSVNSVYELDVGKIDHWCLGGGNEGCRCEDPLVPVSRVEIRSWNEAFKDNVRQIEKYMEDPLYMADLDVAIIGESAIEEMDGRWMGRRPDDELKNIGTIFKNHFSKTRGAKVEGVALGIAGDAANNVLWRLLHGEMPAGFEPKIWWVSVGMNDLTRQQCSEEVVVLGVLRVVEEILRQRPKARVVVNSLLPMADLRGGTVVKEQDYRDAFSTYGGKRTRNSATRYVRKKVHGREIIVPVNNLEEKKDKKSSSDDHKHNRHHHHRRLLEMALESYSSKKNDNSDEINYLQDMLEQDMGLFSDEGDIDFVHDGEITDHHVQRYLGFDKLEGEEKVKKDGPSPKRRAKDQYNPTINKEKHEQKKYSFFRKRRMPLWTSIFAINKQLWKFCEKHDRVDFFDATNIFAEKKLHDSGSEKYFTLLSEMISARGHPTELGYLTWEDEMVKSSLKILEEMKRDSPELFISTPQPAENVPGLGGKGGSAAQSGTFGFQGATNRDIESGTTETAAVERIEKKPVINDNRGHVTKTLGQDAQYDQKGDISDSDEEATENKNEAGGGDEDENKENDDDETPNDANNGQGRPQVEQVSAFQPQAQQGYGGMQQQGGMQQGGTNAGDYPQQQQQYGGSAGYAQQQQQYGGVPQQQYAQQPEYGMQGGDQIQRTQNQGSSQMSGTGESPVQGSYQQQPRPGGSYGNYQTQQRGADAYGQAGYPKSGSQRQPSAGMQGGNQGWQNPAGFQGGDSGTSGYQGGNQQQQVPPRSFQSGGGVGGQAGGGNFRAQPQAGDQQDGVASIGGQQQDEETADEGEGSDDDDTPTSEANQGPALETDQAAEGDGGGGDDDTPAEEADQGPALKNNDNEEGEGNDGGNDDDNTPAKNNGGDGGNEGPLENPEGANDEDQGGDDNDGEDEGGNADNTQREEEDNNEDGDEGGNDNAPEDEGGNDETAQEDEGGNDNEGGEGGDGTGDDDNN